jgi:hypothetical protein
MRDAVAQISSSTPASVSHKQQVLSTRGAGMSIAHHRARAELSVREANSRADAGREHSVSAYFPRRARS